MRRARYHPQPEPSVFTTIALVVLLLIVAVLLMAAMKPATFQLQRSITINAPPDTVFPLVNDFHNWARWSPWEKIDPAMQRTFSGAESGRGAVYMWNGNSKAGAGRMEIIRSTPPSNVDITLDFTRPFEAHNITEFTMDGTGGATRVTWNMHGPNTFPGKIISVFRSMDQLVGGDFERGLASLKAVAEG